MSPRAKTTPAEPPPVEPEQPPASTMPTFSARLSQSAAAVSSIVGFDRIKQPAWIIIVAGFVALIASFLPWYRVSVSVDERLISDNLSAWHGFFGWFGSLLLVAAVATTVMRVFFGFKNPLLPLATLVTAGAGCGCVFLALFVQPFSGLSLYIQLFGIQIRHGFGNWLSLASALAIALTAYKLYSQPAK